MPKPAALPTAMPHDEVPLLRHALESPSVFTPGQLVEAVRATRQLPATPAPPVCVLEFDGDLTDALLARGELRRFEPWPCFHTVLWVWENGSESCGLVCRTIGGPYAVLVAEQLAVCGARVIVGLASAGRVAPTLPIPSVVVASQAIRDEGTSFHYLPPGPTADADPELARALEAAVVRERLPVRRGLVWTTDAPYRETAEQMERHAMRGALAVEMQAASLFAFGARHRLATGLVAHVTNAPDHNGPSFDKGADDSDRRLLVAICQAGHAHLAGEVPSPQGLDLRDVPPSKTELTQSAKGGACLKSTVGPHNC